MKNYYEELEVSKTASQEIINKAYKVLAKKFHPDSTVQDKSIAEERFKKISEAYEVLSDEVKRKKYDQELLQTEPQIDIQEYNKTIEDNKLLNLEISKLKKQINDLYSQNLYNSNLTNNYNNTQINTNYIPPKTNYKANNYYSNNVSRKKSYSFLYNLKYKIDCFFKNILAFILTIGVLFIILSILLYIPSTRDFLIENFKIFF